MLEKNLRELEIELAKYHHNKKDLKLYYFDSRLQESLEAYNHELDVLINSLYKESTKVILRRLHNNEDNSN